MSPENSPSHFAAPLGMEQPDPSPPGRAAAPVARSERIAVLDVLRGFALLGVFLVNLSYMAGPSPVREGAPWFGLEVATSVLITGLFETKFVTLFSLLFGMGLVLQMERGRAKGGDATRTYLRRLGLLFLLGLLHGTLLFEGDILFLYSLAGCLLLACHRFPVGRLVLIGLGFLSVGLGLSLFWSLVGADGFGADEDAAQAMLSGPLAFTLQHRATNFFALQFLFSIISFNWRVVAMFFFGAALMRSGALGAQHRGLHGRLALGGLMLGLLLESYGVLAASEGFTQVLGPDSSAPWLGTLSHELGSLALALGLGSGVCWVVHGGLAKRLCDWLAAVGRTALTNYLLQSLLMNLLLMWYGLGLWGSLSRPAVVGLVLLLFPLQVLLSVWWSRRFAYGPAEWAWRALTYGRRPRWRL